jgi:hypothetical protein
MGHNYFRNSREFVVAWQGGYLRCDALHFLIWGAVQRHVQEKWLLLYIKRLLAAPGVEKTGE